MAGSKLFHTLTIPETLTELAAPADGLTSIEAKLRLGQHGANVLP
mgnify:CR=1 FL=1